MISNVLHNIKQFQLGEALVTYARIPNCLALDVSIVSEDFSGHFTTHYNSLERLDLAFESKTQEIAHTLFLRTVSIVS